MSAENQCVKTNVLADPAKIFDSMAAAIRTGEDFDSVLAQFGFEQANSKPGTIKVAGGPNKDRLLVAATKLADDLHNLIGESEGVAGLHRNGDVADWESLMAGGRNEQWLMSLDALDAMLAKELLDQGKRAVPAVRQHQREQFADAPSRIFLQVCGDGDCEELFSAHSEVSWCDHRVHDTDIEYVRTDAEELDLAENLDEPIRGVTGSHACDTDRYFKPIQTCSCR